MNITREELFAEVWERPVSEIARELGVSDTAIAKLCRKLQVPKPPRGYWARVAAGQTPRRSALAAFREESTRNPGSGYIKLTDRQMYFFRHALRELGDVGVDTNACQVMYDEIRALPEEVAAQVILLVHNRHENWLDENAEMRARIGALQCIKALVGKLLPYAKAQVVVFRPQKHEGSERDYEPIALVRFSAELQRTVAHLSRLVRDNGLSYVVRDLGSTDVGWRVRYVYSPDDYTRIASQMCISDREIWVRSRVIDFWGELQETETERFQIRSVVPVDLLKTTEIKLPAKISSVLVKPYVKRLEALKEAEHVYDIVSSTVYKIERAVPDEHLAIADRLWFGKEGGPFTTAHRASVDIENELGRWETAIEEQRATLCVDVLGVRIGDTVVASSRGKMVRIRVERMSLSTGDEEIFFHLWGRCYRKDGTLGKRDESVYLMVGRDP